ncbi:MAG: hypothetical protein ACI8P0_005503 [Planctomycetaceae bacterium]|jgi:hypothetical protein
MGVEAKGFQVLKTKPPCGVCRVCRVCSVLVAAKPIAHLISELAEEPGHLRRWFLPQQKDQEFDPRVWCRPEAARQSTGPGVRDGELEHQGEKFAARRAVRIACRP